MSILETISGILEELKVLNLSVEDLHGKLDRLLASKPETKSIMGHPIIYTNEEMKEVLKEPKKETRIHSPGFEDYKPNEVKEGISLDLEYEGRQYKGKWTICKFKCGALTSWPADYKKGDQKLHVHPTDKEILGFAQEDMNGDFKCPMVVKK